ncbi:hypothetical protein DRJ22_01570 [Candidatus Woesearchaeota archaeon]|nr:MAG: hypothetical protein B6U93_04675 [Candidatus Woesearchaeota archaeon ex4484_78]RLE46580.1 MAG: hypothetical protein DRJ22_01570 [Candidatus Woesearchaeota archaeon]
MRCKKNYVVVSRRQREVVCYDCQKEELHQEIKDPKMKHLFDIPEDFFKKNSFLRNIKLHYLRSGSLTPRQIEAFKKTVDELKKEHGTK